MKKNLLKFVFTAIVGTFIAVTLLAGCSKASTDENGFCKDGKTAIEIANKSNKNILLIATMEEDDLFSSDLVNLVLKDSRFNEEIGKNYTVLLMDFSEASYAETAFNDESTKEERKIAEEKAEIMQKNTLLASRLNLQLTPAIYIMSKDMYLITQLDFLTEEITNYDSFKAMIEKQQPLVDDFVEKIEMTEKGSKTERLAAIDDIYETTSTQDRTFLLDLINKYIDLDKKNESGLLSKYLLAKADIESSNYFMGGDIGTAVKIYADTAKDLRLTPEHRQNCYYLAAYILILSNSMDFEAIESYLQNAIDSYPEGPNTPSIKMALDQMKMIIEANTAAPETPETAE